MRTTTPGEVTMTSLEPGGTTTTASSTIDACSSPATTSTWAAGADGVETNSVTYSSGWPTLENRSPAAAIE